MKKITLTYDALPDRQKESPATAATIGHFDGVHVGHRHVIDTLRRRAGERGLENIAVVTFDRQPRSLFDPEYRPLMLTTLDERMERLERCGVDVCAVLQFDRQMASLTAYEFMEKVLRDALGVKLLLLGYDNRFGKRVEGEGFADYVRYGKELGIEVLECDVYTHEDGTRVSSSLIRKMKGEGKDISKYL